MENARQTEFSIHLLKQHLLSEGSSTEMSKRTAKSGALFYIVYNIEVGCFQRVKMNVCTVHIRTNVI